MEITFVRAIPSDAEEFVLIQNRAFYLDYMKYGECPGYGRTVESMAESMLHNIQFKIMADGVAVGKVSAHETEGRCHLDCLCVVPEYENRGIGQKALQFIEAQFENAIDWTLETPKRKYRNHSFYQKCGYEVIGEDKQGPVEISIFYKRVLRTIPEL